MISLLVMLIIAIGLLGTVGWSVFTFQKATDIAAMTQRNASHMEGIVNSMRAAVRFDPTTGKYMVPNGTSINARTRLPGWVVGDDHTPWGAQYAYCPLSGNTVDGPTGTVLGGRTTTYGVMTTSLSDDHGAAHDYVNGQSGQPTPPGLPADVVGFILSPAPYSSTAPDCADVSYQVGTGYYVIAPTGDHAPGSIFPVSTAGISQTTSLSAAVDPVIHVAPTASGTGSGLDAADPMAFADALTFWHTTAPKGLTLDLAAGTYTLSDVPVSGIVQTDLTFSPGKVAANYVSSMRGYLYIKGPTDGTAALVPAPDTDVAHLRVGVNFQMDNVTVDDAVVTEILPMTQASLFLQKSGPVLVEGGTLAIATDADIDLTIFSGMADATMTTGGKVTLKGGTASVYAQQASGGTINVLGGTAQVYPSQQLAGATFNFVSGTAQVLTSKPLTGPLFNVSGGAVEIQMTADPNDQGNQDGNAVASTFNLNQTGGYLTLASKRNSLTRIAATAVLKGGTLMADAVAMTLDEGGITPTTQISLRNGATLSTVSNGQTTSDVFTEVQNVCDASDPNAGCSVQAMCPTDHPHLVSGDCNVVRDAVLVGHSSSSANASYSCRFTPAVLVSPGPNGVNEANVATDGQGRASVQCSSVTQ